ncbi:MAG TPA: YceI family protein [Myxococcaceae bacterium]|nr:YceI family protein [Myxococcaceae bacterium]
MTWKTLLLLLLLPALAGAEPRAWTLQKGTGRARFRVEAPLDSIDGSTAGLSGELRFDEASWAEGTGKIHIALTGFTTGLSLRDEDLRDQFFQVDRFPEAVLTITRIERPSQGILVPGREGQADAVGALSLHGKDQPVRIPISVLLTDGEGHRDLQVTGTFDVPFTEYGIPRPARLFLKLGTVAHVRFEATFRGTTPAAPAVALAAAPPAAAAPAPRPPRLELSFSVAHRPERAKAQPRAASWEFAFTSPEGRGERLFRDPAVGGEQNALACASCHSWRDERSGALDPLGHTSSNSSLWNSARRATFWRDFASTPEDATDLCVRRFMLRPAGGDPAQLADLAAYLKRISPDTAPPLDYRPLLLGRKTAIDRPTGGDGKRGALLTERFCGRCHGEGAMRPPLEVGLYEPDYLVARVRWIGAHDAKQMPPVPLDRLTDTELRDIVTHLVGRPDERIFQRRRATAPRAGAPAQPSEGPLAAVRARN